MHRLPSFVTCFLTVIWATVSVSSIKTCKPKDVACQKESAIELLPEFMKGMPHIGLPAGNTITLDDVEYKDNNIKLSFRNMKVTGFSKCKILNFSRNLDESTMTLFTECPIVATGQYNLSGQLLLLPAEGDGDCVIETNKAQISVTAKVKVEEKAGAKHWKITKFDYKYDIIDKASITLENLFGGDETRAKPIREVLQNNPTEIIKELGGPIIEEICKKLIGHVQKFFYGFPISKLES